MLVLLDQGIEFEDATYYCSKSRWCDAVYLFFDQVVSYCGNNLTRQAV
jgi:hypothetical protein